MAVAGPWLQHIVFLCTMVDLLAIFLLEKTGDRKTLIDWLHAVLSIARTCALCGAILWHEHAFFQILGNHADSVVEKERFLWYPCHTGLRSENTGFLPKTCYRFSYGERDSKKCSRNCTVLLYSTVNVCRTVELQKLRTPFGSVVVHAAPESCLAVDLSPRKAQENRDNIKWKTILWPASFCTQPPLFTCNFVAVTRLQWILTCIWSLEVFCSWKKD